MRRLTFMLFALVVALAAGCAQAPREVTQTEIDVLAQQIASLAPDVDPGEAMRAATIAFTYPMELRERYGVTDGPIIHNAKVNNGLRPRGLCVHWAEDLEARLDAEDFRTLQMHRAIAEGNEWRIDHSTAIISRKGDAFDAGIVLDPWRFGGPLYWAPTTADAKYVWEPQRVVLLRKQAALEARQARTAASY